MVVSYNERRGGDEIAGISNGSRSCSSTKVAVRDVAPAGGSGALRVGLSSVLPFVSDDETEEAP